MSNEIAEKKSYSRSNVVSSSTNSSYATAMKEKAESNLQSCWDKVFESLDEQIEQERAYIAKKEGENSQRYKMIVATQKKIHEFKSALSRLKVRAGVDNIDALLKSRFSSQVEDILKSIKNLASSINVMQFMINSSKDLILGACKHIQNLNFTDALAHKFKNIFVH